MVWLDGERPPRDEPAKWKPKTWFDIGLAKQPARF
jgi:hypothetical protein